MSQTGKLSPSSRAEPNSVRLVAYAQYGIKAEEDPFFRWTGWEIDSVDPGYGVEERENWIDNKNLGCLTFGQVSCSPHWLDTPRPRWCCCSRRSSPPPSSSPPSTLRTCRKPGRKCFLISRCKFSKRNVYLTLEPSFRMKNCIISLKKLFAN